MHLLSAVHRRCRYCDEGNRFCCRWKTYPTTSCPAFQQWHYGQILNEHIHHKTGSQKEGSFGVTLGELTQRRLILHIPDQKRWNRNHSFICGGGRRAKSYRSLSIHAQCLLRELQPRKNDALVRSQLQQCRKGEHSPSHRLLGRRRSEGNESSSCRNA